MGTSTRRRPTTLRDATLSSAERHAKAFRFKDTEKEWMTHAAGSRCDSVKSWLSASRHGSFGKMSHTRWQSTQAEHSGKSSKGWANAGIAVLGEFWTLDTSESPSDAVESSLSDIVETGNELLQCYLTTDRMKNVMRRLQKYGADKTEFAEAVRRLLGGPETKRQSSE